MSAKTCRSSTGLDPRVRVASRLDRLTASGAGKEPASAEEPAADLIEM